MTLRNLNPRQLFDLKVHRAYRERLGGDGENAKTVLVDLADANFLFKSTFNPKSEKQTFINEGRRLCVLEILYILGKTEKELLDSFQPKEAIDDG